MAAGVTVTVVPVTVPTVGLILRLVAPLTDQDRVLLCPVVMLVGLAVKLAIVGFWPDTVTETVAVVEPAELVAVKV